MVDNIVSKEGDENVVTNRIEDKKKRKIEQVMEDKDVQQSCN